MRLRDYFLGRGARLHSTLPVEEVAQVAVAASGRFYWFWKHPVTGGRWDARLRFSGVRHPWENNAKPIVDVMAREEDGGTGIWLTQRAPTRVVLGMILATFLWALFLSVFLYVLIFSDPQNVRWSHVVGLLAGALAILAMLKFLLRNADGDFSRTIELFKADAQAREVSKAS